MSISLARLQNLPAFKQIATVPPIEGRTPIPPSTNEHLHLVIRQLQMQLPVEPLLKSDPLLANLVHVLLTTVPKLLHPSHPIRLHTPLAVPLDVGGTHIAIEAAINLGFHRGKPKLFEWGVRSPELNWRDHVKLWVATQYFQCPPELIHLTVIALHPEALPQVQRHTWSLELHNQTQSWLIDTLDGTDTQRDPCPSKPRSVLEQLKALGIESLDEIEEIAI